MENSPLSDRFVADEDDAALELGSHDEQRSHDPASPSRAATRTRSAGGRTHARSWMRAGAVDWGIRIAVVGLVIGGFYALYINGVAEGWWHAWGETPTVAATGPTAQPAPAPTVSSEAAMSGGYQIGPDGVLVRPAEFAADTYTKPELPEAAKENTERGAELTAEYAVDTLTYAWNTGDTQPFAHITEPGESFRETYIKNITNLYANGWMYDNSSTITGIVSVEPVTDEKWGVQDGTIGVVFKASTNNGTACIGQRIIKSDTSFDVTLAFFMTWKDGHWIVTGGGVSRDGQ